MQRLDGENQSFKWHAGRRQRPWGGVRPRGFLVSLAGVC